MTYGVGHHVVHVVRVGGCPGKIDFFKIGI
jgi:hypothetical protein